jgi:hypothetical protein
MARKEKTHEELISAIYQALFSSQYSVHFHVKNLPGISIMALPLQQDACASNWVVNIESGDPELRAAITQHPWFNTSLTWFPVTVNQRLVHLRFFFRTLQAEMDRVREKLLS